MGQNKRKLTDKIEEEKRINENKIQELNDSLDKSREVQLDRDNLSSQLINAKISCKNIEEKQQKEKMRNDQLMLEKSKNDKEIKKLSNKILDLEEQNKS